MTELSGVYKIKTNAGYYYSVSNGRYGRFGGFQDGWRLCQVCADLVIESFTELGLEPELEQVNPWHCQRCQVKAK
jgi:hypothetical protein